MDGLEKMAILKSGNLIFEFRFKEFDDCGWVQYEILFKWGDQPIINDSILKRYNEHWANRSFGAFKANDHREDSFIQILDKVLETNEPDYWEPIEPDVTIGIYPDMYFPFLESHLKLVWEKPEAKQKREERERGKSEAAGRLPDDPITLVIFVDQYNMEDCEPYSGEGPALIMVPTRKQLETFAKELKKEYMEFKNKYPVDEFNKRALGSDWKPIKYET